MLQDSGGGKGEGSRDYVGLGEKAKFTFCLYLAPQDLKITKLVKKKFEQGLHLGLPTQSLQSPEGIHEFVAKQACVLELLLLIQQSNAFFLFHFLS